jgi:nitroimidazol reductase NimA-like FMN-containing flavoprotein (pyridoxamine 5'-phosphate oxidase superfamily)
MDDRTLAPTERTRLRRRAERGAHDLDTVEAILDEALVAHVGFAVDGRPWVVPFAFVRIEDHLYLHGAAGNFALRTLATGVDASVAVTLLDGLVLARSAFHHSINYRSVILFGRAEPVTGPEVKQAVLTALVEHLVPGRSTDSRPPTAAELRTTLVVRLAITEASAKVRSGPPVDDPADVDLPFWAGEVPLTLLASPPVPDLGARTLPVPAYLGGPGHH